MRIITMTRRMTRRTGETVAQSRPLRVRPMPNYNSYEVYHGEKSRGKEVSDIVNNTFLIK